MAPGYPPAVARSRPARDSCGGSLPFAPGEISVVVITRNRRHGAMHTVQRLLTLPERPDVIVVDNGSTDGTSTALRRAFSDVRLVTLEHNRGAAARTLGVESAATRFVAFSDDDSWWEPGSLAHATRILDSYPRLAILAARILVGPERRIDPTCAAMARSPLEVGAKLPGPAVLGFVACGAVARRDAFLECDGFRHGFGVGGEETLLAIDLVRRGWLLAYVSDVVAHHHPSPARDPGARRRQLVRNALWETWLRRPWSYAVREGFRVARRGVTDRDQWRGLLDALAGVPAIIGDRAVVPPHVENWLQTLEAHEQP
jgi:GT2 family glycosyltransferase